MSENQGNPLQGSETDVQKAQKAINGLLNPLNPKEEEVIGQQEAPTEEKQQNSPEPQNEESETDQPQEQEISEETESEEEEVSEQDVSQDEEQIDTQEMLTIDKRLKNFLIRENNFNLNLKSKDKTILKS